MFNKRLALGGILVAIAGITGLYFFQQSGAKPRKAGAFRVGFLPVT